jgi:hypothetical protein
MTMAIVELSKLVKMSMFLVLEHPPWGRRDVEIWRGENQEVLRDWTQRL